MAAQLDSHSRSLHGTLRSRATWRLIIVGWAALRTRCLQLEFSDGAHGANLAKKNGRRQGSKRRVRTQEEKDRDPRPEQRGLRGPRPGTPDPDDLLSEEKLCLPAEIVAAAVAWKRARAACFPDAGADHPPDRPSIEEKILFHRLNELATVEELRKRYTQREREIHHHQTAWLWQTVSSRLIRAFGDQVRLWMLNRKKRRFVPYVAKTVGQPSIGGFVRPPTVEDPAPDCIPGKIISRTAARKIVASLLDLKNESAMRNLAKDRISVESVAPRALRSWQPPTKDASRKPRQKARARSRKTP